METVMADLIREKCVAYIDDILVVEATLEEHLQNLRKVLERFREAGLKLKPSKCHFLRRSGVPRAHSLRGRNIA